MNDATPEISMADALEKMNVQKQRDFEALYYEAARLVDDGLFRGCCSDADRRRLRDAVIVASRWLKGNKR